MRNVLIPIEKQDTKLFIRNSNILIRYLNKHIFISMLKREKEKLEKYNKRKDSLVRNKKISLFPPDLITGKGKIAVYTALYGDYDSIKHIVVKNPFCDYFIFTDQSVSPESGWIKINFAFPDDIKNDPILKNRFLKMHPHLIFQNYEYSIYLDASIVIRLDIYRLLSRMGTKSLGLYDHGRGTQCLYEEAEILKRIHKLPDSVIDNHILRYKSEGFPEQFGFVECTIIVRKHNNPVCINVMNTWWHEFINGPRRDQLSFMYSVWKNGLTKNDIAYLGATYWDDPIIEGVAHKK